MIICKSTCGHILEFSFPMKNKNLLKLIDSTSNSIGLLETVPSILDFAEYTQREVTVLPWLVSGLSNLYFYLVRVQFFYVCQTALKLETSGFRSHVILTQVTSEETLLLAAFIECRKYLTKYSRIQGRGSDFLAQLILKINPVRK